MARPVTWRSSARIARFCIVGATVPLSLLGLVFDGEDGAVSPAVFGFVIGLLAAGFGAFVAWPSRRRPRAG